MVLKALNDASVDVGLGDVWDVLRWEGAERRAGIDRASIGIGAAAVMRFLIRHQRNARFVTLPFGFREITGFDLGSGDYYMGLYLSAEREGRVRSRARVHLNHVSAHLSDGLYDAEASAWVDGRTPTRYSRESLQLLVDVELPSGLRVYAEGSRLYLHDGLAGRISRWWGRGGLEFRHRTAFPLKPWAALDVRTFDVEEDANGPLGIRLVGGLRLGNWNAGGISAVISHYHGPNWRGQYYNEGTSEWQVGLYTEFR